MDHVNERLARLKHLLGIVEEEQDGLLSTALQLRRGSSRPR